MKKLTKKVNIWECLLFSSIWGEKKVHHLSLMWLYCGIRNTLQMGFLSQLTIEHIVL